MKILTIPYAVNFEITAEISPAHVFIAEAYHFFTLFICHIYLRLAPWLAGKLCSNELRPDTSVTVVTTIDFSWI